MKRLCVGLLALILLALPAMAGVTTVFSTVSAASGSSGEINTSGGSQLRVQACGASFTGGLVIKQGAKTGALATTKTLTLTGLNDCSEYYWLNPSTLTQIDYTRSAGTLTVYLEWYP